MFLKAQIQMDYSKPNAGKIHIKWLDVKIPEVFVDYEWQKKPSDYSGVVIQLGRRYDGIKHLFTDGKWHYFEATKVSA